MEGRHVKGARAMLGLSQTDLCKAAGISRQTLVDIENDAGDPKLSSLRALEEALIRYGARFAEDGETITVRIPKHMDATEDAAS
ncbi:hypothetical protein KL86APRO_12025 [uncultured Alphaproteobacteria bacterium]|uniref:HTH cro/C1-type domain-containing protein n=1 Tax=uncultured Alphaproteobacteria bacterium TaxID=91750 RepID=A0A212K269_9PROT|nr:hypothetical protein KL86APRO_12025 [uncultured Alphaproteobacteria bacterium]